MGTDSHSLSLWPVAPSAQQQRRGAGRHQHHRQQVLGQGGLWWGRGRQLPAPRPPSLLLGRGSQEFFHWAAALVSLCLITTNWRSPPKGCLILFKAHLKSWSSPRLKKNKSTIQLGTVQTRSFFYFLPEKFTGHSEEATVLLCTFISPWLQTAPSALSNYQKVGPI